jgi:hypothetical protein
VTIDRGDGKPAVSESHLTEGTLLDLVRDVISERERDAAEAHLAACPRCAAERTKWERFAQRSSVDAGSTPPDTAVARVLALGEAVRPRGLMERLAGAVQLVAMPVVAGVRDRARPEHEVHAAEDVAVEIRVSRGPGSHTVVVGQLTDRVDRVPFCERPVLLRDDEEVVARTLTNEWGEFHLEHPAQGRLGLEVVVSDKVVRIPLGRDAKTEDSREKR